MSFGPNPRQQANWDLRAAANFMAGGAGGGLLVTHSLVGAPRWLLAVGAALVGFGLFAVWLEIGRPLRAVNVLRHPRRSWMTREAFAATVLFGCAVLALAGVDAAAAATGVAALTFVYCQGRILQAAKGIPAWREPLTVPLIVATALAEGAGLHLLLAGAPAPMATVALFGAALAARLALWLAWRRRIAAAPRALAAIDQAGHAFKGSTLLALAAVVMVALAPPSAAMTWALPAAGLLALAGGQWFKLTLVLRGGFTQGFALPHLPVRGVRRG
jgi:phenylacetyl-CoA:acceptor oxidoreductase subunit 2